MARAGLGPGSPGVTVLEAEPRSKKPGLVIPPGISHHLTSPYLRPCFFSTHVEDFTHLLTSLASSLPMPGIPIP